MSPSEAVADLCPGQRLAVGDLRGVGEVVAACGVDAQRRALGQRPFDVEAQRVLLQSGAVRVAASRDAARQGDAAPRLVAQLQAQLDSGEPAAGAAVDLLLLQLRAELRVQAPA